MKIQQIRLRSYGHFTDRLFAFGDSSFALMYGLNESGKSTLLRGLRESLFGFSKLAFSKGSEIRTEILCRMKDGREAQFTRRRANKKSYFESALLEGKPTLTDEVWIELLGGITLETYTNLFGFGLAELAEGEASLKGENLTEALLGGGQAKSIDWKLVRSNIEKTKGQLLTPKGRNQEIPTLLKSIRDLQVQTDEKIVRPRILKELRTETHDLMQQSTKLHEERTAVQLELRIAERSLEAWPIARRYSIQRQSQLDASFPEQMTAEWASKWISIQSSIESRNQELATLAVELEGVQKELASIPEKSQLAEANELLQPLIEQVSIQQESLQRVEQIESQLLLLKQDQESLLQDLTIDEIKESISTVPAGITIKAKLSDILGPLEAAQRKLESTAAEIAKERWELERNRDRIVELSPKVSYDTGVDAFEQLMERIEEWQRAQLSLEELEELQVEARSLRDRIATVFGDPQILLNQQLPPMQDVEAVLRLEEQAKAQRLDLLREIQRLERKKEELEEGLRDLDQEGSLPTLEDLGILRRQRDQALESLKESSSQNESPLPLFQDEETDSTLGSSLADTPKQLPNPSTAKKTLKHEPLSGKRKNSGLKKLEQLHEEMDHLVDSMIRESHRIAKRSQAEKEFGLVSRTRTNLQRQIQEVEEECQSPRLRLQQMFGSLQLKAIDLSLVKQSLEDVQKLRQLLNKTELIENRWRAISSRTRECLSAFACNYLSLEFASPGNREEIEAFWDLIRKEWSAAQKKTGELEAIREATRRQESELRNLEVKTGEVETEIAERQSSFALWLSQVGLPESTSPKLAEQLMRTVSEYRRIGSEIGRLELEREGHHRRHKSFRQGAMKILGSIGFSCNDVDWQEFERMLRGAGQQASAAFELKRKRELLSVRREEKNATYESYLRDWKVLTHEQKVLAESFAEFDEKTLTEIARKARSYWDEKRSLKSLFDQLVLFSSTEADIEQWIEELAQCDCNLFESQKERCREKLKEIDLQLQAISKQLGSIDQRWKDLQRDDPVTDMAVERQNLLARLESAVERWMMIATSEIVLELAMKRFHGNQEQTIAAEVTKLFRQLTDGRYVDVKQDPKESSRFQVIDEQGEAKHPDQLSTGTREQLYLAIRLAHIRHYCQTNEPLPLVLDDCFVNFDDARLRTTLEVVKEQSTFQQVILLSCHKRTESVFREIAQGGILVPIAESAS